jgi:hypothetical protein
VRPVDAAQPEFAATLAVNFPKGEQRFRAGLPEWEALPLSGLIREMGHFPSRLELTRTVFRSDHASNRLVLQGTLSADEARLLAKIRLALEQPDAAQLRPAWAIGL